MDMVCKAMVLLLKLGGGFRGLVLVEVIWKLFSSIMNNNLQSSFIMHDAVHGFSEGRETGTATLEAKLAQQLAGICHDPLFKVLLFVKSS